MFGSAILDVVIGIAFVYLLVSLIASAVKEWISRLLKWRAETLQEGIRRLLDDPEMTDLAKQLYDHPLIAGLSRGDGKPSYIPARTFASALLDCVAASESKGEAKTCAGIRSAVAEVENDAVRRALLPLIDEAQDDLDRAKRNIERWFDDAMDRVSGWYRRRSQAIILVLAVTIVGATNADTFMLADHLWRSEATRSAIVAAAQSFPNEDNTGDTSPRDSLDDIRTEIDQLSLPLGWFDAKGFRSPDGFGSWVWKLLGLLLTSLAVSLGAPFWFDVLSRLTSLRATGGKPPKSDQATDLQRPR